MIKDFTSFSKNKPAFAVGFLFTVSSLLFGIWVAAIPGIKVRPDFTDGTLGLSLLLAPLGSVSGMLLSTIIFSKISVGKWMYTGYTMICFVMIAEINSINRLMFWIIMKRFLLVFIAFPVVLFSCMSGKKFKVQ